MFEKNKRQGLIVYLHYNKDAKKLSKFGDIYYHSRRKRYLVLYTDKEQVDSIIQELKKYKFIKKVLPSYIDDLNQDFVGNLWRENECIN